MVEATWIPETRDTKRTWRNICVLSSDILRQKDKITPSQLSDLMGALHKALFVNKLVEQDSEEIILKNK